MHACYLHYSLFDVQCLSLARASFRDSLYKINDYTHSQPGHVSLLTLLPFLSRASTLLFSSARHPICTSCIRSVVLKISVSVEVLHIMCVCRERERTCMSVGLYYEFQLPRAPKLPYCHIHESLWWGHCYK